MPFPIFKKPNSSTKQIQEWWKARDKMGKISNFQATEFEV